MLLPPLCQTGILLRRYKRFLADVCLADGRTLTVHCPNSGSMRGCSTPGSPVVISHSDKPGRKYAWTLEMVKEQGVWIGVHTGRTNHLVREALESGVIDVFGPIFEIRAEVRVEPSSRIDFLLATPGGPVYLEVKNCSLVEEGLALFPDAVTARGTKHLEVLIDLAESGVGAAVLFCVQRADALSFAPAAAIDSLYAQTLARAAQRGVRILAYRAEVEPTAITLCQSIPWSLRP